MLKKEQHLDLEDSWVSYDDKIQRIYVQFSSQRLLTIEQARLQMVKVVEGLLLRLNNHTLLSYELSKFPFTAKDINVKINYESYFGLYVDELYVGLSWLQAGCVNFYAFNRKDPTIDWDHSRFEPYFKSRELALLKEEADLPFTNKDALSDQVDYRGYGRYQGYSPNKAIETRYESQPRPRQVVLVPGRDDENANENIQTILPMYGQPNMEIDGMNAPDTSFFQEDADDATMFLNYDEEGSPPEDPNIPQDPSSYPYDENMPNQQDNPEQEYEGMPEGYMQSGYPMYQSNNQAPNYDAEILNQNIDAGSLVPDVLNTEIDPGSFVPDPGLQGY